MKAVAGFVIVRIEVMPGGDWLTVTSESNWSLPVPVKFAPQLHVGMSLDVDITINAEEADPKCRNGDDDGV